MEGVLHPRVYTKGETALAAGVSPRSSRIEAGAAEPGSPLRADFARKGVEERRQRLPQSVVNPRGDSPAVWLLEGKWLP